MELTAVTLLEPTEVAEQCGELIDALVQLLVGDGLRYLVLRFGDPDEGGLVPVLRQVAVDTVIGGVQPTTDEPLPEGRVAGIERRVPVLVPGEEVGILLEAFGEVLLPESVEELLFPPMDGDLRLGNLHVLRGCASLDRHRVMQPPSMSSSRITAFSFPSIRAALPRQPHDRPCC